MAALLLLAVMRVVDLAKGRSFSVHNRGGRGEGEEGGDGVEGGGLGVTAAAGDGDGVVESTRRLIRQALPRGANRRRHRRRAYMQKKVML